MILALALADPKAAAGYPYVIESASFPPYMFGSDFLRFIRGSLDEFGNLRGAVFFTGSGPWGEGRGGLPEWRPAGLPPGGAVTFVAHIDGNKMILPPPSNPDEMIVDKSGVVGKVGTLKVTRTVGPITLVRKYTLSSASARSVIIEVKITNHGSSAVRGKAWLGSDDDFLGGEPAETVMEAVMEGPGPRPSQPETSVGTFAAFGHAAPPTFSRSLDAASSPCGNALELKNDGAVFYANTPPAEGSVAILEAQGYLSDLANPGERESGSTSTPSKATRGPSTWRDGGGSWAIHMDFGSIGAGGSATRTVQFGAATLADIDELSAELALPTCGQYFDGASIADAGKYVCAFREPNKIEPGGPPVDVCRRAKVPPSVDKAHVCHADGLARELARVGRAACPRDARLVVATHPAPALETCRCNVHPEGFVPPPGATACTKTTGGGDTQQLSSVGAPLFGPGEAVECFSPSRDYDPAVGVQDGGALTWRGCRSDMTPCKMAPAPTTPTTTSSTTPTTTTTTSSTTPTTTTSSTTTTTTSSSSSSN